MASNPMSEALERLKRCQISGKDYEMIFPLLGEWYSSNTLNNVLEIWETHNNQQNKAIRQFEKPLIFSLFNVQGLNSRNLEVLELIHRYETSFIICTEVGKLWNSQQIPDFNIFHEERTNKNGGVIVGVGKHLKALKVETSMKNTVVVDIFGLNESLRVIGMYWPESHQRNIDEITPYITKNTIISGDFNASVAQWNSSKTDKRGAIIKQWSENNNVMYIQGTINSSKRSDRNIDFTFSTVEGITGETIEFGSSDHRPIVYKSEKFVSKQLNSLQQLDGRYMN